MKVQRLDIDRLRDTGAARNATLYFKGVPILYTPWLDFPLSSRRKTDLLPPTYRQHGEERLRDHGPVLLEHQADMDYTIAPRVMSKRGVLLNNEFRYLRPSYSGQVRVRVSARGQNQARRPAMACRSCIRTISATASAADLNMQRVSDDTYFTDLSDKIAATSQTLLPQKAQLRYEGDWWSMLGRSQRYQTLQDPLAPITPPYARSPQVTLLASQQNVVGFDMSTSTAKSVNFDHPFAAQRQAPESTIRRSAIRSARR